MGFFSNLFKKGEEPLATFIDPQLGIMQWSKDDGAWLGNYQQRKFGLAYEGKSMPTHELITYAHEILEDTLFLNSSLADAKAESLKEYPKVSHEEIKSLSWGSIHFYHNKGIRRILADLEGGKDYRAWRIEYHDRHCEGIGFDD